MPTLHEIFSYLSKLVRSWWLIVPVVVGAVRLVEWLFRHGKPFPIPPRARWCIAIGGVFIAQFLAYEDTERARALLDREKTSLDGQLKGAKEENDVLSKKNQALSQQPRVRKTAIRGEQRKTPSESNKIAIDGISQLAEKGTLIQQAWLSTGDTEALKSDYAKWLADAMKLLASELEASYGTQFQNARGSAFMGCPPGKSNEGCGYWQDIQGKRATLMNFITELRQAR